jgi:hypothetical protein
VLVKQTKELKIMSIIYKRETNTMVYVFPIIAGWSIHLPMKQGGMIYKAKFYMTYPKFIIPAVRRKWGA